MDSSGTQTPSESTTQPDEAARENVGGDRGGSAIAAASLDTKEKDSEYATQASSSVLPSRKLWYIAFKNTLPVYIAIHLAFFVITCLSILFVVPDFSWDTRSIYVLWQSWHRWDTGHYMQIAWHGYDGAWRTVFFPLYPLLERALMSVTNNPFTAGLLISNIAGLVMLVVLYRLVQEDFDQEQGLRIVLYISIFPTAFFFAAAYNESLSLCLALLSFYHMRHGHWWLAGLFGFFMSLTRSAGLLLLLPFCYEYLRQHSFQLKAIRFDIVSGLGIPAGIGVFALYCFFRFHDPLAFSHAESGSWGRKLQAPWYGIVGSVRAIGYSHAILSFHTLRNLTDLVPDLLVLALVVLIFVGPWRFPRRLWSYGFYAVALYLFLQFFPLADMYLPLQSVSRYLLEIFPAFILLARIGKNQIFHMSYLMVSGAILFFLLTQFLTGHWVI